MDENWIIAIFLFVLITFLVWKFSVGRYKREFSKKRRKLTGQRAFYWEGVLGISIGLTFLTLLLLRWVDLLTF